MQMIYSILWSSKYTSYLLTFCDFWVCFDSFSVWN